MYLRAAHITNRGSVFVPHASLAIFFLLIFFCLVVISIFTLYQQLHVCVMADRFEQVRKAH